MCDLTHIKMIFIYPVLVHKHAFVSVIPKYENRRHDTKPSPSPYV